MLENGNSPPADPPRAEERARGNYTTDRVDAIATAAGPPPPPPMPVRVCSHCSTPTVTSGAFCPHCASPYVTTRPRHHLTRRGKLVLLLLPLVLVVGGVTAVAVLKSKHSATPRLARASRQPLNPAHAHAASSAVPAPSKPKLAQIGDSITFDTNDTTLRMTVLGVIDPLSASEYDQPDAGKRFVGVRVAISNVGGETYSDSVSNGAQMIDSNDEQADSTIVTSGECSSAFSSDLRLSPGSREVGCIPFEINVQASPKTFQFAGDSGFGPDNVEWRLTGAAATPSSSPATTSSGATTSAPAGTRPCDQNISAGSGTTCPFAENLFKAYWRHYSADGEQESVTVEATSPATGHSYTMQCDLSGGTVDCTGGDGAFVTFPLHAVEIY